MGKAGRLTKRETLGTDVTLLRLVLEESRDSDDNEACMATKALARSIRVSEFRVGSAFARLESAGLIVRHHRFDGRGSQLSNSVALTADGLRLLDDIEKVAIHLLDEVYRRNRTSGSRDGDSRPNV